jgi:DNA-binding response OmpR family regulator
MKYKYKVLIIDNKVDELVALKQLLEQEGFMVEEVNNGIEAIDKVKNEKFHIILLEIDIPVDNGLDLLRYIKKCDPMAQLIIMSEQSSMDIILYGLELGANDYIYKPLSKQTNLLKLIDISIEKLERWKDAIKELVAY